MNKTTLLLLTLLTQTPALAAETPNGEQLHSESCLRCHGVDLYSRADRKVKSLPQLQKRVNQCKEMLGVAWFDEEVAAVSDYLNRHYYHLTP